MPDLDAVFARHGATKNPGVAALQRDIERSVQAVLTRVFRVLVRARSRVRLLLAGAVAVRALRSAAAGSARAGTTRRFPAAVVPAITVAIALVVPAAAVRAGAADFGAVALSDPCTASPDPYPGRGFDAATQRLVLSGVNGAACDLGISREELVLSLEPLVAASRSSGIGLRSSVRCAPGSTVRLLMPTGVTRCPQRSPGRSGWAIDRTSIAWFPATTGSWVMRVLVVEDEAGSGVHGRAEPASRRGTPSTSPSDGARALKTG